MEVTFTLCSIIKIDLSNMYCEMNGIPKLTFLDTMDSLKHKIKTEGYKSESYLKFLLFIMVIPYLEPINSHCFWKYNTNYNF